MIVVQLSIEMLDFDNDSAPEIHEYDYNNNGRVANENHSDNNETESADSNESTSWFDCEETECINSDFESSENTVEDYEIDDSEKGGKRNFFANLSDEVLMQGGDLIANVYYDKSTIWFDCKQNEDGWDNESINSGYESSDNTMKDFVISDSEEGGETDCFVNFTNAEHDEALVHGGDSREMKNIHAYDGADQVRIETWEGSEMLDGNERNLFAEVTPTTYYSSLRKVVEWIQLNQYYFDKADEKIPDENLVTSENSVYDGRVSELMDKYETENNLDSYDDEATQEVDTRKDCPTGSIKTEKKSHPLESEVKGANAEFYLSM